MARHQGGNSRRDGSRGSGIGLMFVTREKPHEQAHAASQAGEKKQDCEKCIQAND